MTTGTPFVNEHVTVHDSSLESEWMSTTEVPAFQFAEIIKTPFSK